MNIIKQIRNFFNVKFEKHPVLGSVFWGALLGFVGTIPLLIIIFLFLIASGIYSRLNISYKTWLYCVYGVAILAFLVLVYGITAFFPYRRKGNYGFKKDYKKGTTYKALHSVLDDKKD